MPYKCTVYGCTGNYSKGPKVSVFKFPKDTDLLRLWTSRIMKENFKPTSNSRICELHFRKEDVIREFLDEKSGVHLKSPLLYPRLKDGAVPMILPNEVSSCLQPTEIAIGDSSSKKRKRVKELSMGSKSKRKTLKSLKSEGSSDELKQPESFASDRPSGSTDSLQTTTAKETKATIDLQTPSTSGTQTSNLSTPTTLTPSLQCAGPSGLQCFSPVSLMPNEKTKLFTDSDNKAYTSILEPQIIIKQEIIEPEEDLVDHPFLLHSASCPKDSTSHVLESDRCSSLGQKLVCSDDINTRYPNLKTYFKQTKRPRPNSPKAYSSKGDPPEESEVPETNRPKDQFDAFGVIVASKLRNLDWKSRDYVQKAIEDLLFEAELGFFLSPEEKAKFGEKNDSIINGLHEAVADTSS